MTRLVPQWAARLWCRWTCHRQREYSAEIDGVVLKLCTCRCGDVQSADLYAGQFPRRR